jgi:hypothetical protein
MSIRFSRSCCWAVGLLVVASSFLMLPDAVNASPAASVRIQAEDGTQLDIGTASTVERAADPVASAAPTATPAGQALATRPTATARPGLSQGPKWFGVLQASGRYGADLKRAGVSLASLELVWSSYEPQPGVFDDSYAAQQRQKAASLRGAGVGVVLDAGLQYAPGWLFDRDPNAYFVNQYGDRYSGGLLGTQVGNGVFDPLVRQAQSDYLKRIASDLGDGFVAIRVGGGWYGELHFPAASYNGHSNSYWAYDANAVAGSPVKGWSPGQPSAAQAQAFWSYYTGKLTEYLKWQLTTYRSHFSSSLEILYPGWGVRPGDAAAAIAGLLSGQTPSEVNGETQQGNDFAATLSAISDPGIIPYSTWLDAPDKGTTPNAVSPIRYLQLLAAPRGLSIAGENADSGRTDGSMRLCIQRVRTIPGMAGMMWLAEPDLIQSGQRALGVYGQLIQG